MDDRERLLEEVRSHSEWLQTTEGDEVHCVSMENLAAILTAYKIQKQ